jgi:signal transduction histidine kinase
MLRARRYHAAMSHRRKWLVAAAAAIAVTLLLAFGGAGAIELPLRDVAMRLLPKEPAANTIVVAIDEQSLRSAGAWPWKRTKLAEVVDRIAAAGTRALVVDILLAEEQPGDDVLAASMRKLPTLAVAVLDERGVWLVPAPQLAPAVTAAHGNFELDHDGIVRRLAATKQSRERSLTALPFEAASLITGAAVPIGVSIAPAFRTPPRRVPQLSAADLLAGRNADALRGKLVFLGPTALALGDRVLTPVSGHTPDPGVTVHAAAAESLIRGETVREIPPIVAGLFAAIAVAMLVYRRSRAVLAIVVAAIIGGGLLLLNSGIAIPFATLLGAVAVLEIAFTVVALRQSRATAAGMETRLQQIATRVAEQQAAEAESKRVLAHELKTPIASMRGLTQLLGGYDLSDAERKRVTSLLEAEAGKLQSMVTALLDLERLPLRDFDSSAMPIDLGDLVAARTDFLRASTDREINVTSENVAIRGDAALIERVVDNLVGNALKYTNAGVDVHVRRSSNAAIIEVDDHGSGITSADRERIFDRFFRGSTARGTQGLGLGLALVAEVARWHGGTVSVDEAPGGGARFRVVVPLAPAAAKAGAI